VIVRGVVLAVVVAACALLGTSAGGTSADAAPPVPDASISGGGAASGFLGECAMLTDRQQVRCYTRELLDMVEQSGDPANELPRIDRRVHAEGGLIESSCHVFMHEVGRTWAKRHRITFGNIYRFVPRSNDPGCSAGFGMGLTMYLGPQLVAEPRLALETCSRLPTRFREYTCIHGTGHALMRGYHGVLDYSVKVCRGLGAVAAPDCSQGAFHDYWISLGGGDDTTRPENAETSPRELCGGYSLARPCWYRYFWEREPATNVYQAADITELCDGLEGLQRAGCVGGASLLMSKTRTPVAHALACGAVTGADADPLNCLRGVTVPSIANRLRAQLRLIETCGRLPLTTRWGCYSWFGRTLSVVTDGAFRRTGCTKLEPAHAVHSCAAGADRRGEALRTFS
jgi:hypothetical protein